MADSKQNSPEVPSAEQPKAIPLPHSSRWKGEKTGWRGRMRENLSGVRHWARSAFTRENVIDQSKTLAWVIPLTFLIWVYAEREQVAKEEKFQFPIEVRSNDANKIVTIVEPRDKKMTADLQGPQANLERVKDLITPRNGAAAVVIRVDASLEVGDHPLPAQGSMDRDPIFHENGISIENCRPASVTVHIDRYAERTVEIQVPTEINNIEPGATFEPKFVKVRGPESLLTRGPLVVYADLSPIQAIKTPGPVDQDVTTKKPFDDEHVTVTPAQVHVNLKVRQSDVTHDIGAMPIWIVHPDGFLKKYDVVFESGSAVLRNVTVQGPKDTIEMFFPSEHLPKTKNPPIPPKAILEVSDNDVTPAEFHDKPVKFDLPKGITAGEAPIVRFKLVERTAAP